MAESTMNVDKFRSRQDKASMETIVVTGGCGFIGQHIVRQLMEQRLFPLKEIRIFDIQEFNWFHGMEPYTNNSQATIKYVKGDIGDIDQLQSAFQDATTVIHSAGDISVTTSPDKEKLQRVNVKGTENVIQACINSNTERLVFTSSVDAFLPPEPFPTPEVTEEQVPKPHKFLMGPYAESKFNADKLVLEANNKLLENGKKLKTCALRIPFSYGEGDVQAKNYIGEAVKQKKLYLAGGDENVVQKMYAGNAAWAHVLAVSKLLNPEHESSPAGKGIFIGDHTPLMSFSSHYIEFARRAGASIGPTIPIPVLYAIGAFVESIAWVLSPVYSLRSETMRATAAFFTSNNYTVSWELSRRCLGYSPIFSYKDSVERSWVYLKKTVIDKE
ncbi:3 beta-hydroxysteroid dehydrogenase/Delta 5--_4-isomerase type 3-like [Amphiura filiformis]|uniref:3 beta-hydroxysteroid dehydrogenase/Delta 5-->4-isomerase type 3-like n=1 Tax=Amphiura filiformis TaxID=82378 RepID=UPI003B220421